MREPASDSVATGRALYVRSMPCRCHLTSCRACVYDGAIAKSEHSRAPACVVDNTIEVGWWMGAGGLYMLHLCVGQRCNDYDYVDVAHMCVRKINGSCRVTGIAA